MKEKEYLTKEKFHELEIELHDLKTNKRREIAEQLHVAKGMGDLSENAEYHEARDEQAKIEFRISQLEQILKHAIILDHKKGDTVEIGSQVTLIKTDSKEEQNLTIVGSEEADISKGKISNQSPLGIVMIGKKKGEIFEFKTARGKTEYKILDVK
jgi:transcription elongation factor GreA